MSEHATQSGFARVSRPLLMAGGACALLALGALAGTALRSPDPLTTAGNHSDAPESTHAAAFAEFQPEHRPTETAGAPAAPTPSPATPLSDLQSAELFAHTDSAAVHPPALAGYSAAATAAPADLNSRDPLSAADADLTGTGAFGNQQAMADEHLRSGNYLPALRIYRNLHDAGSGAPAAPLLFRLALCAEAAGNHAEATDIYRQIRSRSSNEGWQGVALLGEARCLLAQQRHDLLQAELLRQVLLDESVASPAVHQELLHLLARSQWSLLHPAGSRDYLDDSQLAVPAWAPEAGRLLDDTPALLGQRAAAAEKLQLTILHPGQTTPDTLRLRVHSTSGPAERLLASLLQACQFSLEVTDAASRALSGHNLQLHVQDRRLSLILDGFTVPYGLCWQQNDRQIRLMTDTEVAAAELPALRLDMTERLLQTAIQEGATVRHCGYTRMALSALLFQRQKRADAAHVLRVQLESAPGSAIESTAAFNLGKCQLSLHQFVEARDAFLLAIDAAGGPPDLRAAAYMYTGRLQTELGEPRAAVSTMMRGLSLSQRTPLEADAALLLSSLYLFNGNPQAANDILMERRDLLQASPYHHAAAFLSAYARFTAAVLADRREREARSLVAAIAQIQPERQFGAHWCLLVSEAAEQTGLQRQSEHAALQLLALEPAAPLRNRAVLRLAADYRQDNRFREASQLLASLVPHETGQFSELAALRAAEVALQLGQPQDSIVHCRALLNQATSTEVRRAALKVMGSAYEKQQNHQAAVYCFAGLIPEAAQDAAPSQSSSPGSSSAATSESPAATSGGRP